MSYIGQREDEWEAQEKKKARKAKLKLTSLCPICEKRVHKTGLKMHLRDVHQMKMQPITQPAKFKLVPYKKKED